ncbi:MAG: DUF1844 domain-containing protein [Candidatus Hydrogenedentes bacterium]|nr:DUF1844 domain-containing protein [Candidatus Hydrogenedentota bacterium]
MSDDDQKIFIDEDWKARVQREKEEARKRLEAEAQAAAAASAAVPEAAEGGEAPAPAEAPEGDPGEEESYEANFDALLTMLATQTMYALGFVGQQGEQVMVNLDQARFSLELLLMLRGKTAGNLTPEESAGLDEALAELQRLFVGRVRQMEMQAMQQAGIDPSTLRTQDE